MTVIEEAPIPIEDRIEQISLKALEQNDRGTHYVPADIYGNSSFKWDGEIHAWAMARFNPQRAAQEVTTHLNGQWREGRHKGFIPNQVFDSGNGSRDHVFWSSKQHPDAPRHVYTSGITQPALLAEAIQRIAHQLEDPLERKAFVQETVPAAIDYSEWVYRERNTDDSGLMSVIHAWETGMDNTPPLMQHLRENMSRPLSLMHQLPLERPPIGSIIRAIRRDTRHFPAEERSTNEEFLMNTVVAARIRSHKFDIERIKDDPFIPLVQDIGTNSIFIRNNVILRELVDEFHDELSGIGVGLSDDLLLDMAQTEESLNMLWSDKFKIFFSRDARTGELLDSHMTAAGLLALYAGTITVGQESHLVGHLNDPASFKTPFRVPNVAKKSLGLEDNYDRFWNSVWPPVNMLIVKGLLRARAEGAAETAHDIRDATLGMVAMAGVSESYSPVTGNALGAPGLSMAAAAALELALDAKEEKIRT